MRKITLFMMLMGTLSVSAADARRPMLKEGKSWHYTYHQFTSKEYDPTKEYPYNAYDETTYPVTYTLKGDTVIDGLVYMKMYRRKDEDPKGGSSYYAAYREQDGRVYVRHTWNNGEELLIDFSLKYDEPNPINVTPVQETIKVDGTTFTRYRYQGTSPSGQTYWMSYMGVEGVGFAGIGLNTPFAPEPDCICDYESFDCVIGDIYFSNADFMAPKQIELTADEQQLVKSSNEFALNLMRRASGEKDLLLSPLSITYALGMVNNGAVGQTQLEINKVLGFGGAGADAINKFCRKLLDESATLDQKTRVLIANNIYMNQGYTLKSDFQQTANDYYDAQPETRDFADGETMDVINQWASDHTEKMIDKVLNEDEFTPLAVSYLLNAIYFKGAWQDKFDLANTKVEEFQTYSKQGWPNVPMMQQTASLAYTENKTYQAVRLPYGNGAYVMTVLLPQSGNVWDVLKELDGDNWQFKGRTYDVDLKLPRFETKADVDLKPIMSDLGMPTAFTDGADFSNFCNVQTYIELMKQVAKIKVDEEGTEAAAVTVIGMEKTSMVERVKFHANRPFLYIISEQSTGAILFIGQYMGTNALVTNGATLPGKTPAAGQRLYNLQGQRLSTPPTRGLYIKGDRKVLAK